MSLRALVPLLALTLSACSPVVHEVTIVPPENQLPQPKQPAVGQYVPPEQVGLTALRPYPTPIDVCQIIKATGDLQALVAAGDILIGCPSHETGAIADRRAEGARRVGQEGGWVLLTVADQASSS